MTAEVKELGPQHGQRRLLSWRGLPSMRTSSGPKASSRPFIEAIRVFRKNEPLLQSLSTGGAMSG